jgi:hypothetical protein
MRESVKHDSLYVPAQDRKASNTTRSTCRYRIENVKHDVHQYIVMQEHHLEMASGSKDT